MTDASDKPVSHRLASHAPTLLITAVLAAVVAGQAATAAGLVAAQPSATLQDSPTVTVADQNAAVGETVTVPVRLSEAPAGVAGFNLSVTTTDPTVVEIVDATVSDQYGFANPSTDETRATLVASDTGDAVQSGATDIRLGTVTLRAESAGTAELRIEITQFDDDEGARVAPEVATGTVTVGAETQSTATETDDSAVFQTPGGTDSPTQTASPTPTPTASLTPTQTASDTPTRTASDTATRTASATASPTESDPAPPEDTPTTGESTTETGGDGFGAVLGVLALLGVVGAIRRRSE